MILEDSLTNESLPKSLVTFHILKMSPDTVKRLVCYHAVT